MMNMLHAGGLEILTDGQRAADDDNPRGYYEYEKVKALREGDTDWVVKAAGKVVKVIATLLPYLPDLHAYKVLFMEREISEVLASQKRMLVRRGEDPNKISDNELTALFEKHVEEIFRWIDAQPAMETLIINYNQLVQEPQAQIMDIEGFIGGSLNTEAMVAIIDPSLYRHRT